MFLQGRVFENDREFYNQIWKRSGWMKRLFGGKHMMRSGKLTCFSNNVTMKKIKIF